jgi:hypothetical protein
MKKKSIPLILTLTFLSQSTWAMKLTSTTKSFELKETTSKTWVSKSCNQCEAEKIFKTLKKEQAQNALKQDQRGQVPIGTRLCSGLGGMVWVLLDEKNEQQTVCEFKDHSVTLTSDLSALAFKLLE